MIKTEIITRESFTWKHLDKLGDISWKSRLKMISFQVHTQIPNLKDRFNSNVSNRINVIRSPFKNCFIPFQVNSFISKLMILFPRLTLKHRQVFNATCVKICRALSTCTSCFQVGNHISKWVIIFPSYPEGLKLMVD